MAQELNGEIDNLVQGDKLDIIRTIGTLPGAISKAWFTVRTRANLDQLTDTTTVVFQKAITTVNVPGVGVISDDGAGGTATVRFELRNADTKLVVGDTLYFYDIQVIMASDGEPYTPEVGKIKTVKDRTKSIV
jgi:hypothetical protein